MMATFLRILSAMAILSSTLLSGCSFLLATESSEPYTADDVSEMTASHFAVCKPRIVSLSAHVEKEKPFQRNLYVLYDEANDVTFSCRAVVRRPTLPLPCAQRDTNAYFAYAAGYAAHLNARIRAMAEQYRFRCAITEEAAALIRSKVKRRQGDREVSIFDEGEFIFVSDGAKGEDMVTICKGLYDMYKPEGSGVLLSALYGRKVTFYYLPPGEEELTKAVFLLFFQFEGRHDWGATLSDNPGSSLSEKEIAVLEKNLAHYFDRCLSAAKQGTHST